MPTVWIFPISPVFPNRKDEGKKPSKVEMQSLKSLNSKEEKTER